MRVYLGSDHAGFEYKEKVKGLLSGLGHSVEDQGPTSSASCDYPDFAIKVARIVSGDPSSLGILVCGTGIGMSIAANKIHGARAAVAASEYMARMSREHNGANILCLGARVVDWTSAELCVKAFLAALPSTEGRHALRRSIIDKAEAAP